MIISKCFFIRGISNIKGTTIEFSLFLRYLSLRLHNLGFISYVSHDISLSSAASFTSFFHRSSYPVFTVSSIQLRFSSFWHYVHVYTLLNTSQTYPTFSVICLSCFSLLSLLFPWVFEMRHSFCIFSFQFNVSIAEIAKVFDKFVFILICIFLNSSFITAVCCGFLAIPSN